MSFATFNQRYLSIHAEKEKGTTLTMSAFRSEQMDNPSLSIAIFAEGSKGPVFKESLNENWIAAIRVVWKDVLAQGKGAQKALVINSWDRENKKAVKKGAITLGIDEQDVPFIGITAPNLTKKFPLQTPFNPDVSSLDLSAKLTHELALEPLMAAFRKFETASGFAGYSPAKRNGQQGGGYRGGNGGGSSYSSGGGSSYGGSSAKVEEDSIPF